MNIQVCGFGNKFKMSFTTNLFANRVGIDFSEPYHTDPVYRFESLLKMKNYIKNGFPEIPYFREHDNDGYEQEYATLSGVFGVCLIAMIYGLKVTYSKNNWPVIDPASHLSVEEIKKLKPFDLYYNPVVELEHQLKALKQKFLHFQIPMELRQR